MTGRSAIVLVEHDPEWSSRYSAEERVLREVFGTRLLDIAHHGSTAVPGLIAKPIVDIVALVASQTVAREFVEPLREAGYGPPLESSERIFLPKSEPAPVHLSIAFADFARFFERQVLFRDWLRDHADARDEYARLKLELAATSDLEAYSRAKSPFVWRVLSEAGFRW